MLKKIDELESNPEMFRSLMQECIDKFKPSWMNGKALNNFIFGKIGEICGFEYEKKEGMIDNRLTFHRFDKDVLKKDENV